MSWRKFPPAIGTIPQLACGIAGQAGKLIRNGRESGDLTRGLPFEPRLQPCSWRSARPGPIVVQLALAMLALLVVAFTPPAQGRMLLVPLDGRPVSEAAIAEMRAIPLVKGPLPGFLVVDGERRRLSGLRARRVLVLAAPSALCSSA